MISIASDTGIFMYKLSKSRTFIRLKLSFKMPSNLLQNSFRKYLTKINAGVKIKLYPATIGLPTGGFFKIFQRM
jgi:hypothetical protein